MKHLAIPLLTLSIFHTATLPLPAAVPVPWTVDMRRAQPATFEAYQGETLDFKASLTLDGKPFEAPLNYSFFWQTNGMVSTYWEAPANSNTLNSNNSNTLFATWLPSYDVGARVYNCFIGSPSNNYHTAFQLRLRPSPGATPNALPLPVPVIDFAKVSVINPPWGAGGFDTNAVIDIIHKTVDGAARPLPRYLHALDFDDSYPADADRYYVERASRPFGSCSSVRDGGFLSRNYDWTFDDAAEFVVRMSASTHRFASVGVANVGTNLTEAIVTSGKPSRYYKCLPGRVVDGINENGVVCEVNVVDGEVDPDEWTGAGNLHPLAAVRWVLDHATNALHAAKYLKENIKWPQGWKQNFHWMIADATDTYIVENGDYHEVSGRAVMTNFPLYPAAVFGSGWERYQLLTTNITASITNVWYTRAYDLDTDWVSEFGGNRDYMYGAKTNWNSEPKEAHRGERFPVNAGPNPEYVSWWQTVHTSVYDLTNRVLRVAVQEVDDWYTFAIPCGTGVSPVQARAIAEDVASSKLDKTDVIDPLTAVTNGPAADAKATADALANRVRFDEEQSLTDGQKVQARANIGAGTSNVEESSRNPGYAAISDASGFAAEAGRASDAYMLRSEYYQETSITMDIDTGKWIVRDMPYQASGFFLEPPPDISGKLDAPAASAVTDGHVAVFKKVTNDDNTVTVKVEDGGTISSRLNTYIDGETGVEYVGKFYGGSLYYVPTGNVYPPNN